MKRIVCYGISVNCYNILTKVHESVRIVAIGLFVFGILLYNRNVNCIIYRIES